jgi:hypothetical protein
MEADPIVQGFRLRKSCKEINSNFAKFEVQSDFGPLDPGGCMVDIHVF